MTDKVDIFSVCFYINICCGPTEANLTWSQCFRREIRKIQELSVKQFLEGALLH